jgi:hypothetical protein
MKNLEIKVTLENDGEVLRMLSRIGARDEGMVEQEDWSRSSGQVETEQPDLLTNRI